MSVYPLLEWKMQNRVNSIKYIFVQQTPIFSELLIVESKFMSCFCQIVESVDNIGREQN